MEEYKYWEYKNEDLVPLAKQGDQDAYKQLFYNLRPIIIHHAVIYRDRLPIYDMDDYKQEAYILIWKLCIRDRPVPENFAAYFSAALRYRFINIFFVYAKHNHLVIWTKEGSDHNISFLVPFDYPLLRKEREKEIRRRYRERHAEQIAERERNYRLAHREERNRKNRIYMSLYYRAYKEQLNEKCRLYRLKNQEALKKKKSEWYYNHRDEELKKKKEYYQKNREKFLERARQYYYSHREEILEKHIERNRKNLEMKNKTASDNIDTNKGNQGEGADQ